MSRPRKPVAAGSVDRETRALRALFDGKPRPRAAEIANARVGEQFASWREASTSLRTRNYVQALGDAINAAVGFLDAGDVDAARAVLSAARLGYVNHLRDRVSREPGGLQHAAGKKPDLP